jgi:hypothetical protein
VFAICRVCGQGPNEVHALLRTRFDECASFVGRQALIRPSILVSSLWPAQLRVRRKGCSRPSAASRRAKRRLRQVLEITSDDGQWRGRGGSCQFLPNRQLQPAEVGNCQRPTEFHPTVSRSFSSRKTRTSSVPRGASRAVQTFSRTSGRSERPRRACAATYSIDKPDTPPGLGVFMREWRSLAAL